jgi:aminopeptidase N
MALSVTALAGCTSSPPPAPPPSSPGSPAPSPSGGVDWKDGESVPVADPVYPAYGNPAIDVLHYGLAVSWAPTTKTFTGQATVKLRAVTDLTSISLDFSSAYTVDQATVDGATATAAVAGHKLTVPAHVARDDDATLVVAYHGTPATTPMPSHRSDVEDLGLTVTADGLLWTMQEPYGASTWYPVNDQPSDKARYDIAVTVPAGWSGVAAGTPQGQTGNTFKYTSADPMASYLQTLAIGQFTEEQATGPHGLPLTYWYRKGVDDAMMAVVRKSPQLLQWLEDKFGPYPFPSAGVVLVPSNSAMETQQMITMGDKLLAAGSDPHPVEVDLLHEYAHHWFGDAVTPTTWKDLWLNEGFAEYAQLTYDDESKGGHGAWPAKLRSTDNALRQQLGPPGSPRADSFAERNVYVCPALMLAAIHAKLGDAAFYSLLTDWVKTHDDTAQDRGAFTAFAGQHSGQDLTALINAWLDSPTTPA